MDINSSIPSDMKPFLDKMSKEGVDLFGGDANKAGKQLDNFWKTLDDMAANNPKEYDEFIKKQMDYGKDLAEQKKKDNTNFFEDKDLQAELLRKSSELKKEDVDITPIKCVRFNFMDGKGEQLKA